MFDKISRLIIVILILCNLQGKAQVRMPRLSDFRIQFDLGMSYMHFDRGNHVFDGLGYIYVNKTFLWRSNSYQGINLSYKNKHFITFNRILFFSEISPYPKQEGILDFIYRTMSIGYGYQPFKKLPFTFYLEASKRYRGGELYQFNNSSGDLLRAYYSYESWGTRIGLNYTYMFTRNIGIGAELFYNYYSKDKSTIQGEYIEIIRPELVATYQPINQFTNGTLKLVFSFGAKKKLEGK